MQHKAHPSPLTRKPHVNASLVFETYASCIYDYEYECHALQLHISNVHGAYFIWLSIIHLNKHKCMMFYQSICAS